MSRGCMRKTHERLVATGMPAGVDGCTNAGGGTLEGNVNASCPDYNIESGGGPFTLDAGESVVVAPTGEVLARAPQREAAVLDCTLRRADLRRGRTPYAHLRDEDPGFMRRALDQLGNRT